MSIASGDDAKPACTFDNQLPDDLWQGLLRHFSPRRSRYVARVLSTDELRVANLADALTIARIKRMSPQQLKRFDCYVPIDAAARHAYDAAQMEWIRGGHYLLSTRLGRSPTQAEVSADFNAHRNGQRFRAYYVMKYPQRMKPITRRGINERAIATTPTKTPTAA